MTHRPKRLLESLLAVGMTIALLWVGISLEPSAAQAQGPVFSVSPMPGPARGGLQLGLVAQSGAQASFAFDGSLYLLMQMTNLQARSRSLEALSDGASLTEVNGLHLQCVDDRGRAVSAPYRFFRNDQVRRRRPLHLAANETVEGVIDLYDQIHLSSVLMEMFESADRVMITVRVPQLDLESAPVTIEVTQRRHRP